MKCDAVLFIDHTPSGAAEVRGAKRTSVLVPASLPFALARIPASADAVAHNQR